MNPMKLKSYIKKISNQAGISPQLVLQNYILERFLERISVSDYKDKFILKGGLLIASIVGLNSRSTMDMDVTIKGFPLIESMLRSVIVKISSIDVGDPFSFKLEAIKEIREGDEYTGYRVSLTACYPPLAIPLKVDITSGDKITPKEVCFKYKKQFEDGELDILSYNIETIFAEKLETIFSRGVQNTRARDFYDIYILMKIKEKEIAFDVLSMALYETSKKRGTSNVIEDYLTILEDIALSEIMLKRWNNYIKDFDYAKEIKFNEVIEVVTLVMSKLV